MMVEIHLYSMENEILLLFSECNASDLRQATHEVNNSKSYEIINTIINIT